MGASVQLKRVTTILVVIGIAAPLRLFLNPQLKLMPVVEEWEESNMPMPFAKQEKENDEHSLPCTLKTNPVPIILMSLGRSGTASMYQVLAKLSGSGEEHRIYEYTGGSLARSQYFFRKEVPDDDVYGDWLTNLICHEQRSHPDAGIAGFKWKPYETIFTEEKAKQGLQLLARLNNPQIKVIRSRRNVLDVEISRYKHSLSKKNGPKEKIHAHCQKDDEECLAAHLKAGKGITLPTRRLVQKLEDLDNMENKVDDLLEKLKVPRIKVSFEKLFLAGDDVSEWLRIFRYLGVGPTNNLTTADVAEAGHAATSLPFHNDTLSNYEEVRDTLIGTKFASLLH